MEVQTPSWVWERLWHTCALSPGVLRLVVPPTVLFSGGIPTRWLDTDASRTIARPFNDQGDDAASISSSSALAAALSSSEESIALLVRQRAREFLQRCASFTSYVGDFPILVLYRDGSTDTVSSSETIALCEHGEWRGTVALLQPALPDEIQCTGLHLRGVNSPRLHSSASAASSTASAPQPSEAALKAVGLEYAPILASALSAFDSAPSPEPAAASSPPRMRTEEADALAADLVKAIEQTFTIPNGSSAAASALGDASAAGGASQRNRSQESLRVHCLAVRCCKAPGGGSLIVQPLLTLTKNVAQDLSSKLSATNKPPLLPSYMRKEAAKVKANEYELTGAEAKKSALAEADRAACAAHEELQRLTDAALASGVPLVEVWAHFDPEGTDVIDEAGFRDKLRLLGIELHDLPFAALLARIQARPQVDGRNPALQAFAKIDPNPIKHFGPAEFFAFLQRDPAKQFLPPPPKPVVKSSATAVRARLEAAAAARNAAAAGDESATPGSLGASGAIVPSAASPDATTTALGSGGGVKAVTATTASAVSSGDAYVDAQAAYQQLASRLKSALSAAQSANATMDGAHLTSASRNPTSGHGTGADVSSGTLTMVSLPDSAYQPGNTSALRPPSDILEARALPDSYYKYRALASSSTSNGLSDDARPSLLAAQQHLLAATSVPDASAATTSAPTGATLTSGGGNTVQQLVDTYSQAFKEIRTNVAIADAKESAERRKKRRHSGSVTGGAGSGARRRKSGTVTAGTSRVVEALAAYQSESSLRLSYNLPRVEPLKKPQSLLPPRPRRASMAAMISASSSSRSLLNRGASSGRITSGSDRGAAAPSSGSISFDTDTVRLGQQPMGSDSDACGSGFDSVHGPHYAAAGANSSGASSPSSSLSTYTPGPSSSSSSSLTGHHHHQHYKHPHNQSWAPGASSSSNSAYDEALYGPATFPLAGTGGSGLWTNATASPYINSVDGTVRGGLFDPDAIRRLGVPQIVSGSSNDVSDTGMLRRGSVMSDDGGIDDRFLIPDAAPVLNSSGVLQAFIEEDSPTKLAEGEAIKEDGRQRVVAELERRGLPTDGSELELLERLEEALDQDTARTAQINERLRLRSEQEKKRRASVAAASSGSIGGLLSPSSAARSGGGASGPAGAINVHTAGLTSPSAHASGGIGTGEDDRPGSSSSSSASSNAFGGDGLQLALRSLHPPPPEDPAITQRRRHDRHGMGVEDDRSRKAEAWAAALVTFGQDSGDLTATLSSLGQQLKDDELALLTLAVDRASERRGARLGQAASVALSTTAPEGNASTDSFTGLSAVPEKPSKGSSSALSSSSTSTVDEVALEMRRASAAKFAAMRAKATVDAIVLPGEAAGYALDVSATAAGRSQVTSVLRRLCGHVNELRSRRAAVERNFRKAAAKLRRIQMQLVQRKVQLSIIDRGAATARRDRDDIRAALLRTGRNPVEVEAHHQYKVAQAEVRELISRGETEQRLFDATSAELSLHMITTAGYAAAFAYIVRRCDEKEAILRDHRVTLARTITDTREQARHAKNDQEQKTFKALKLTAHLSEARARLDQLRVERIRIRNVTARFVDTTVLAAAGTSTGASDSAPLQRVETDGLRSWLSDEILRQKLEVADASAELDELQAEVARLQASYTAAHDDVIGLSRSLRAVAEVLRLSPPGSSLQVGEMLERLFEYRGVVKHVGRSAPNSLADAAGAISKDGKVRVDLSDVFGPAAAIGANGAAGGDDEEADPIDEDAADVIFTSVSGKGAGASGGVGGSGTVRQSRRDASIAWRARQLNREVEIDTYISQMVEAGDQRTFRELGLAFEPETPQQSWYVAASSTLALTDGALSAPIASSASTSAAAAAAPVGAAAMLALTDGIASSSVLSSASANGADASALPPTSSSTSAALRPTAPLGYASPSLMESGMHSVIGVPAEPEVSAFPVAHAPPSMIGLRDGATRGVSYASGSRGITAGLGLSFNPSLDSSSSADPAAQAAALASDTVGLPLSWPIHSLQLSAQRLWSSESTQRMGTTGAGVPFSRDNNAGSTALSSRRGSRLGPRAPRTASDGALVVSGGTLRGYDGRQYRAMQHCKIGALVRWLKASDRISEQKQWIALDRRLYPRLYARTSAEDEKVYAVDPAYACSASRETLLRLACLPASPLQALAYMRDPSEAKLHGLIVKYQHGLGEEVERLKDQESGARAVAMAAVARGYIARTKAPSQRTAEEADWVALDCIVRPHLYVPQRASSRDRAGSPNTGVPTSSVDGAAPFTAPSSSAVAALTNGWIQPSLALSSSAAPSRNQVDTPSATAALGITAWTARDSSGSDGGGGGALVADVSGGASSGVEEQDLSLQKNRRGFGAFGNYVKRTLAKLMDYDRRRAKQHEESFDSLRQSAAAAASSKRRAPSASAAARGRASATPCGGKRSASAAPAAVNTSSPPVAASSSPATGMDVVAAFQRSGPLTRPLPGTLATGYSRDDLLSIMATRPVDLASDRDRRAQLLLRAYGSDGGEAFYRSALARITPVVGGLPDVSDAFESLTSDMKEAGNIDYSEELAIAYPNGDVSNVAASAAQAVQAAVLVRSKHTLEVLSVTDAPLRPGLTADHSFVIPGCIADVIAHGPRRASANAVGQSVRPPSRPGSARPTTAAAQSSFVSAASAGLGPCGSWTKSPAALPLGQPAAAAAVPTGDVASACVLHPARSTTPSTTAPSTSSSTPPPSAPLTSRYELETGFPGAAPVAVDVTVTIVYHGSFVDKSYVLGKLTAAVYREPFAPDGQVSLSNDADLSAASSSSSSSEAAAPLKSPRPTSAGKVVRRTSARALADAAAAAAVFPTIEGTPPVKPSAAVRQALLRPNDTDPSSLAASVAVHGDTAPVVVDEEGQFLGWARDEDEEAYLQSAALAAAAEDVSGYNSNPEQYLPTSPSMRSRRGSARNTAALAGTAAGAAAAVTGRNQRFKRRSRIIASGVLRAMDEKLRLKRENGWYLEDAKRDLLAMGATVAAILPAGSGSRNSRGLTSAAGARAASRHRRSSSADFTYGSGRMLAIADVDVTAGGGRMLSTRGAMGTRATARLASPSPGGSGNRRIGTAGALARRPVSGASGGLPSRGALQSAMTSRSRRPGTVAFSLDGAGTASAVGRRRGSAGGRGGDDLALAPAQPLPLSWQLPSHLLPSIPQDQLVASTRVPIGYAVSSECRPNTLDCFGRMVVRHEPLTAPVLPGRYCVGVSGLSPGSYSISVVCSLAFGAPTAIDGAVRTSMTVDGDIAEARSSLADMLTAERLGERKRLLVEGLISQSEEAIAGVGQQLATLHTALATRSVVRNDLGSDDESGGAGGDEDGGDDDDYCLSDDDGAAADDSAANANGPAASFSGVDASPGTKLADSILKARRKWQRIEVSPAVEQRIHKRLRKLDMKLLSLVRTMHTRKRELADVSTGIEQLSAARMERQGDLDGLLAKAREAARYLPSIIDSIGVFDPGGPAKQPIATAVAADNTAAPATSSDNTANASGIASPPAQGSSASASSTVSYHVHLQPLPPTTADGGRATAQSRNASTAATFARLPQSAAAAGAGRRAGRALPWSVPLISPHILDYVRYGPLVLLWKQRNAAERALELAPTPAGACYLQIVWVLSCVPEMLFVDILLLNLPVSFPSVLSLFSCRHGAPQAAGRPDVRGARVDVLRPRAGPAPL